MIKINPVITKGIVNGSCPKCGEPYTGEIDADDQDVHLSCVACGHEGLYMYYWPDELPKVNLRYKSSRQSIDRIKRKRTKRKKKNPDGKLKGQLAFDLEAVP